MSSKRIVVSCAAMAVAIAAGGWSAVQAFAPQGAVTPTAPRPGQIVFAPAPPSSEVGPLEQRAKPVTPENPIPRRTHFVPVELPSDASPSLLTALAVRITLDESGRVGEARMAGMTVGGRIGGPVTPPGGRDAASVVAAAIQAVKQWRYDPPFEGPLTFNVSVAVGPRDGRVGDGLTAARVNGGAAPVPGVPIRVGGAVMAPKKTRHVNPEYPPIAQSARVQGVVIIEVVINPEGRVDDARILRSIPLLDQAAIDAVRQWEFTPTLLNGTPTPVIMTVTVQFSLVDTAEPPAN